MIDYEEDYLFPLLFRKEGSVAGRAGMFAIPSAMLAIALLYLEEVQPGMHEQLGLPDLNDSLIWNAAVTVCMVLLSFRTKTAFSRFWEGTGLLHQMRGEWFDTVSNCVSFSMSANRDKQRDVEKFRHTLVRLMSLCHGSALEEIADNQISVQVIDIGGLDIQTLSHLQECDQKYGFNKVEVMLHLVQSLITKAHGDAVLRIPPPILSRVYQTISRGFVNLLNAKKITDTKFPFPYAQLIGGLLIFLSFLTPLMISAAIRSKILAAIFTFIPIFGMNCTNLIAMELENPFGVDDNDLPLWHFQLEMNSCLLMLVHPNADMLATVSKRCIMDFDDLLEAWAKPEEDPEAVKRRLSQYDTTRMERLIAGEDIDGDHAASERLSIDLRAEAAASPQPPPALPAPEAPAASPPPLNAATGEALRASQVLVVANVDGVITPRTQQQCEEEVRLKKEKEEEAIRKEAESVRLEAAQREVEKRMNEFYLALQRWTLMIESQVKQIHDMLELLRLLSESADEPGGWEQAIHPV